MKLEYKIFRLKNGLEILLLKRHEKYTGGVTLLLNAGSIYENESNSGISHFFEHLLFDGTKNYPSEEELRKRRQELGLSIGGTTNYNRIELTGTFPPTELEASLKILKEMAFESLLYPVATEKERKVILEEEGLRQDSPYVQNWNLAFNIRFGDGNPLQLPIEGKPESIKKITQKQLTDFYRRHCTASNSKLLIGANFDLSRLQKSVIKIFGDLPKTTKVISPKLHNGQMTNFAIDTLSRPLNRTYFMLTLPRYAGFDLVRSWQNSFLEDLLYEELNHALRIEQGLVYDFSCSSIKPAKFASLTYVGSACDPENFGKVLAIILEKISLMKKGAINESTFERVRQAGNKTLPMNFDTLSGAANWAVNSFCWQSKIYFPEEVITARNKVTVQDLKNTATKLFNFDKLNVSVVGPIRKDEIEKIVKKHLS